jgi:hypothetical protein
LTAQNASIASDSKEFALLEVGDNKPIEPLAFCKASYRLKADSIDHEIFDTAFQFLFASDFDEQMVYSNGMNGRIINLSDTTHPKPERQHYGLCHGQGSSPTTARLCSYPCACMHNQEYWRMRHMPSVLYDLIHHVWTLTWPVLGVVGQASLPNTAVAMCYQTSEAGKSKDERVNDHTDSRPVERGVRCEQRRGSPVLSISWGSTMHFIIRKIINNKPRNLGKREIAALMEHMTVVVWSAEDDHENKHSVRFGPRGEGEGESQVGGERWTLVLRWLDTVREYDTEHPHACRTPKGEEEWCEEKPESVQWAQDSSSWGALPKGSKRKAR